MGDSLYIYIYILKIRCPEERGITCGSKLSFSRVRLSFLQYMTVHVHQTVTSLSMCVVSFLICKFFICHGCGVPNIA